MSYARVHKSQTDFLTSHCRVNFTSPEPVTVKPSQDPKEEQESRRDSKASAATLKYRNMAQEFVLTAKKHDYCFKCKIKQSYKRCDVKNHQNKHWTKQQHTHFIYNQPETWDRRCCFYTETPELRRQSTDSQFKTCILIIKHSNMSILKRINLE